MCATEMRYLFCANTVDNNVMIKDWISIWTIADWFVELFCLMSEDTNDNSFGVSYCLLCLEIQMILDEALFLINWYVGLIVYAL